MWEVPGHAGSDCSWGWPGSPACSWLRGAHRRAERGRELAAGGRGGARGRVDGGATIVAALAPVTLSRYDLTDHQVWTLSATACRPRRPEVRHGPGHPSTGRLVDGIAATRPKLAMSASRGRSLRSTTRPAGHPDHRRARRGTRPRSGALLHGRRADPAGPGGPCSSWSSRSEARERVKRPNPHRLRRLAGFAL